MGARVAARSPPLAEGRKTEGALRGQDFAEVASTLALVEHAFQTSVSDLRCLGLAEAVLSQDGFEFA